jgi:hypothetical protein
MCRCEREESRVVIRRRILVARQPVGAHRMTSARQLAVVLAGAPFASANGPTFFT